MVSTRDSYLVRLTKFMASLSLICFANSLATVASLVWNTRRALLLCLSKTSDHTGGNLTNRVRFAARIPDEVTTIV
jgi:hypothetical protein